MDFRPRPSRLWPPSAMEWAVGVSQPPAVVSPEKAETFPRERLRDRS